MKKIIIILLALLVLPLWSSAQEQDQPAKKKAIYFYSDTCVHCKRVNDYFQKDKIYDKYEINKIESSGPYNLDYLNNFFDAFNVPTEKRGFPAIFFADKMIIGDQPIIDNFVKEIEQSDASEFPSPEKIKGGQAEDQNKEIPFSMFYLIGAALTDAINPCAFAVLILLVATVIGSQGKTRGLIAGLLFSATVFVSYLLIGLGIYKTISVFNLPQTFSIVIGILAILIGLANLKDVFWYGKFFVMEVPLSWRPSMQRIIKGVTSPLGSIVAGLLVSLFLLPCTSGPYLVILGLLAQKENFTAAFPLLVIYNLIFILPMLAISVGMYFGIRGKKLEDFRKNNVKLLHLIAGSIMLFMGAYLLYTWI